MASSDQDQQRRVEPRNEVLVLGRVSGSPVERELPSGDLVVSWRVVIDRPGRAVPGVRTATVDSIDCLAWAAGLRRSGRSLVDGDVVQVGGALRRRFWRVGGGATSRCEVEAKKVRRPHDSRRGGCRDAAAAHRGRAEGDRLLR